MDLMYKDTLIGHYDGVDFVVKKITKDTELYFSQLGLLDRNLTTSFITDRIISKSRKNIDSYLMGIKLLSYDIHAIAKETRLINPMDSFWLRATITETYENFVVPSLIDLFKYNKLVLDNTLSSGGQNEKYYTKYKDKFGIVKSRLLKLTMDTEAELAIYELSKLFKVSTCPVYRIDKDNTFSEFKYNFLKENITHAKHLVELETISSDGSYYHSIVKNHPHLKTSLIKMMLFDYITYQTDRHLSNFAIKNNQLYELYDNGRSLFWDYTEEDIQLAISKPTTYSSTFGGFGTYYNVLSMLSEEGLRLSDFIHLDVNFNEIEKVLCQSGYTNNRVNLIVEWIKAAIREINELDNQLGLPHLKPSSIF